MIKSFIVAALAAAPLAAAAAAPADDFLAAFQPYCGKAFAGKVVTTDEADRDFAASELIMHVRDCSPTEVRIPFHVGENRSRTWILTRTPNGLTLKHDHRHEDGSEDRLTQYGGDTKSPGTATRQEFPADQFSKDLFVAQNIPVSAANIWAVELNPGTIYAYELRRPERFLRVEFDLAKPVDLPPPAWGHTPGP